MNSSRSYSKRKELKQVGLSASPRRKLLSVHNFSSDRTWLRKHFCQKVIAVLLILHICIYGVTLEEHLLRFFALTSFNLPNAFVWCGHFTECSHSLTVTGASFMFKLLQTLVELFALAQLLFRTTLANAPHSKFIHYCFYYQIKLLSLVQALDVQFLVNARFLRNP